MKPGLRREGWMWCLLLVAAWFACEVRAEEVTSDDTQAVRIVIKAQLDAFAADDAARAFAYASPGIQKLTGDAERFIAMVRGHYPVVYRPASVVFLAPQWVDGILVQGVQMTDAAGAAWLAVYTMERQPDRSWRISGCQVAPNEGHAT